MPDHPSSPAAPSLRVMIVDDDVDHAFTAGEILRLSGHEVVTASEGEEALRQLEGGFRADAVVVDLLMPGLDGAGLIGRLQALPGGGPRVVVATGLHSDHLRALLGVSHVLFKPYAPGELLDAVEGHAGAARARWRSEG